MMMTTTMATTDQQFTFTNFKRLKSVFINLKMQAN